MRPEQLTYFSGHNRRWPCERAVKVVMPSQLNGTLKRETSAHVEHMRRDQPDRETAPCWNLKPLCDVEIVLARLHVPICVIWR